jgi:hypothetical protein
MYWNICQQLAPYRKRVQCKNRGYDGIGMVALSSSGGWGGSYGSMLEVTGAEKNPIMLPSGEERKFRMMAMS